ncbi:DUF1275 family protein [Bradyrhizobium sp. WD16]|uniref:DUF1275 family protein n=1 Tax=Bradyrhizobium sp. WD16 TaxID=1521768 RepID=UPI0020A2D111|nr:DUF1275 family protein [Bradyrhizobium sp. WD16]UTD30470.1 hypothetical protein DB459_15885 [Bradyrhizobium sp. WD16]
MSAAAPRPMLPLLLSFNAGYVDTAGFLALQGLFTAHVTGNFVTFGAAMVLGISGAVAKLLALPVFCAVVIATRLLSSRLSLRSLLAGKTLLLAIAAAMAVRLGPFVDGDTIPAIATGMVLVAAMAVQNAVHRIHLAAAPPTTLMTGTTTQIMIDIADLLHGGEWQPENSARLGRMAAAVALFALGCGLAALAFAASGAWCFVLPPVVAAATLPLSHAESGSALQTARP